MWLQFNIFNTLPANHPTTKSFETINPPWVRVVIRNLKHISYLLLIPAWLCNNISLLLMYVMWWYGMKYNVVVCLTYAQRYINSEKFWRFLQVSTLSLYFIERETLFQTSSLCVVSEAPIRSRFNVGLLIARLVLKFVVGLCSYSPHFRCDLFSSWTVCI